MIIHTLNDLEMDCWQLQALTHYKWLTEGSLTSNELADKDLVKFIDGKCQITKTGQYILDIED